MEWRNSAERGVGRDRRSKVEGGWLGTYGTAVGWQAEPDRRGAVQVSTYERCRWRRRQGKLDKTFPGTTHNSPINRFYYTWDWLYYARFLCLDFVKLQWCVVACPFTSPLLSVKHQTKHLWISAKVKKGGQGVKNWGRGNKNSQWTKQHKSRTVGLWGPNRQHAQT